MGKKIDFNAAIEKAQRIHNWKYDYTKAKYYRWNVPLTIICPIHGEFVQTLHNHLQGQGCPKCGKISASEKIRCSQEDFIEKAKKAHGEKYDYRNVRYINNHTKVCIICPEHGEFWQLPSNHLNGCGCPRCSGKARKSTEEFVSDAKKVHGNKYDYSKVEYINNSTKVCIICPEHGEFWQTPNKHLRGDGCPICRVNKKMSQNDFIERAKRIHGDAYDYSKTEYVNERTKVRIICPEHGEFWQSPISHMKGAGCPKCKRRKSFIERFVERVLSEAGVEFESEKEFDWLKYKAPMRIDFYLPKYSIAIECQGEQHIKPVEFFGGEKELEYVQRRDRKKKKLCEEHNIKMIYLYENDIKDKNNILKKIKKCEV